MTNNDIELVTERPLCRVVVPWKMGRAGEEKRHRYETSEFQCSGNLQDARRVALSVHVTEIRVCPWSEGIKSAGPVQGRRFRLGRMDTVLI